MQVILSNRLVTYSVVCHQEDQPSFCTDTDHVISDDESDNQPTTASTPTANTPVSELVQLLVG